MSKSEINAGNRDHSFRVTGPLWEAEPYAEGCLMRSKSQNMIL